MTLLLVQNSEVYDLILTEFMYFISLIQRVFLFFKDKATLEIKLELAKPGESCPVISMLLRRETSSLNSILQVSLSVQPMQACFHIHFLLHILPFAVQQLPLPFLLLTAGAWCKDMFVVPGN